MQHDTLTNTEVHDFLYDGPLKTKVQVRLWLSEAVNYDTASLYFEGINPYDIPSQEIYDAFWDAIEEHSTQAHAGLLEAYEHGEER